ncbi:MAG TPA: carboxypeptidase-like regulatory domain-containing protein [Chitinophagaceae bacterium]|nr:carboxypeptidase-like regulatory domain-containing protein [Chitinophagaceae bacterium]
MQRLRILFSLLFSGFFFTGYSQFTVTGMVLDSGSREPLAAASIFCQNTTLGTYTNKQGEFSIALKSGGYDLIISYTGYQTKTIRVSDNIKLEVLMTKEDKSLSEVVIKTSNEVSNGWEKYGDFFIKNFIGSTSNATRTIIQNPEALKFFYYKRSNKLKVLATDAILIANNAMGYNIRYQLDSFVYYYNTDVSLYRGYCFFSQMEGSDSLKYVWQKTRSLTYYGSKLHFMHSYYDSTIIEDGWIIDMLDDTDKKKFNKIPDVYDTAFYNIAVNERDSIGADSITYKVPFGPAEVEIYFPAKISITYKNARPEKEYLKKMNLPKTAPYQISYIDMKNWITISENGYYYDQKNWVNQGYWSWKNLADQLPYDYNPPD